MNRGPAPPLVSGYNHFSLLLGERGVNGRLPGGLGRQGHRGMVRCLHFPVRPRLVRMVGRIGWVSRPSLRDHASCTTICPDGAGFGLGEICRPSRATGIVVSLPWVSSAALWLYIARAGLAGAPAIHGLPILNVIIDWRPKANRSSAIIDESRVMRRFRHRFGSHGPGRTRDETKHRTQQSDPRHEPSSDLS